MMTNIVFVGQNAISALGFSPIQKQPIKYANTMQKKPVLILVL